MATPHEIIINCRDQDSEEVITTIKNINPAISDATAKQAAIRWNALTTNTILSIIRRQDVDITTAN